MRVSRPVGFEHDRIIYEVFRKRPLIDMVHASDGHEWQIATMRLDYYGLICLEFQHLNDKYLSCHYYFI